MAFAELDIVEEMLRLLIADQRIHEREENGLRIPITQTEPFHLLGWLLEQRVNQLRKQISSWIGPESFQRNYIDSAMLMVVTKIHDYAERMIEQLDIKI